MEVSTTRFRIRPRHFIFGILLFIGLVWILFYDNYSVSKRLQWEGEKKALLEENALLQSSIEKQQEQLQTLDSLETIEKHAREDFGMRRSGETVYRVELAPPSSLAPKMVSK